MYNFKTFWIYLELYTHKYVSHLYLHMINMISNDNISGLSIKYRNKKTNDSIMG